MVIYIRQLQKQIVELNVQVNEIKSKQISHAKILTKAKNIVDYYFRYLRNFLFVSKISQDVISSADSEMHSLLEATHKSTRKSIYKKITNRLKPILIKLEKQSLIYSSTQKSQMLIDNRDQQIIIILQELVPSAANSYNQAVLDLQSESRLSWRGPATDIRESLRECLDHLAPDKDVESQSWYIKDPNTNSPTMKQKATYILRNRDISDKMIQSTENIITHIENTFSTFVRNVYTRASISTHTPTNKSEFEKIHELVRIVMCELLSIT